MKEEELKQKALAGLEKAIKQYREVFDRLKVCDVDGAEYTTEICEVCYPTSGGKKRKGW